MIATITLMMAAATADPCTYSPVPIHAVRPVAPQSEYAALTKTTTAKVEVTLNAEGDVVDAVILKSTNSTILDDAAISAAKASVFSAASSGCPAPGPQHFAMVFDFEPSAPTQCGGFTSHTMPASSPPVLGQVCVFKASNAQFIEFLNAEGKSASGTVVERPGVPVQRISPRGLNAQPQVNDPCDHQATVVSPFTPAYSAAGLSLGAAVVQIDLDSTGKLMNAKIAKTSGFSDLDKFAQLFASRSTYGPKVIKCAGTAGAYLIRVTSALVTSRP